MPERFKAVGDFGVVGVPVAPPGVGVTGDPRSEPLPDPGLPVGVEARLNQVRAGQLRHLVDQADDVEVQGIQSGA
jgi:hypothetical protein